MTATDDAGAGPLWTVLHVDLLTDGARRVLVRKRGGQLVRVHIAPTAADGVTMVALIDDIVNRMPARPAERGTDNA